MALKRNITIIIKLGSLSQTTYLANIIATQRRMVLNNGKYQRQQWAYVFIPGIGKRWIPPSYFVAWAL